MLDVAEMPARLSAWGAAGLASAGLPEAAGFAEADRPRGRACIQLLGYTAPEDYDRSVLRFKA